MCREQSQSAQRGIKLHRSSSLKAQCCCNLIHAFLRTDTDSEGLLHSAHKTLTSMHSRQQESAVLYYFDEVCTKAEVSVLLLTCTDTLIFLTEGNNMSLFFSSDAANIL